ncbi:unnamed protein product [Camellia sinensis]
MTDPTMELLQESGWEELRKEARKIEGDLDVKLSSYAKLGSRFSHGGYVDSGSPTTVGSSRSWKSMEMEIQSLLEKLLDINDAMSRCAASATPTTSVTQKLARHRDILHEFTQTALIADYLRVSYSGMINGNSLASSLSSTAAMRMQEHRSKEAKNALATPLTSHMATPSSFPHPPGEPWVGGDWTLGSTGLALRLQKLVQLVDVVAAMNCEERERNGCLLTGNDQRRKRVANAYFALFMVAYSQEFKRTKGNINSMREHAELLSSVREDISEYKASGSMSPRVQLLRERASIHGSISHGEILGNDLQEVIDDVISQAQSTRAALGSQRAFFGNVEGKVKLLSDKFPIIRGLLGSIRRKKSRDTLILSAVIAACTLFLIIYWLSK